MCEESLHLLLSHLSDATPHDMLVIQEIPLDAVKVKEMCRLVGESRMIIYLYHVIPQNPKTVKSIS